MSITIKLSAFGDPIFEIFWRGFGGSGGGDAPSSSSIASGVGDIIVGLGDLADTAGFLDLSVNNSRSLKDDLFTGGGVAVISLLVELFPENFLVNSSTRLPTTATGGFSTDNLWLRGVGG
ncbi:MAG: hypothetical protein GY696_19795 [Gammaproteobacteria bacterium]|nr:hypothetical protein [Gammaproteobacteria bacterium]